MHPYKRRLKAATTIALFSYTVTCHAEAPDPSATTLTAIEVSGHYDNSVGASDAASEGVILGRLLRDVPLLRPGEALEAIPGLVVTQHSGDGKANQYFLRGYNLDHGTDFAVSVDGVPVNMPTNAHGQGYSDLNFLIPELIERIEYRKGPYFARNGDFASSGSADIYYRNGLEKNFVDVALGQNQYRRILAATSTQLPESWTKPTLLTAIEALQSNGPWAVPEGMRKLNGLARLSAGDTANGWSLGLQAYTAHWRSTDQVPLELIDSGALCRYCAIDPADGGRSARQIFSAKWNREVDNGYLRASGYLEHYRLQLWSDFTYFETDPIHGDQFNQRDARNIFGSEVARGWSHVLLGKDSTTEVGVQLRHDNIHVSLLHTRARVPLDLVSNNLVRETEAALYLQNATSLNDWVRTLIGARLDAIKLDLTAQSYAPNSGKVSDQRVSPKLALIFGPWANTEFFVDVGNGFHSNDARGAVNRFDPAMGTPVSRAPALVGSYGGEIGLRTELVPGLQSSLAIWRLNSASELLYSADSGSTQANGATRRHGVEWNNHLAFSDWLLLDADLAWTQARYAERNANGGTGNLIPNAVSRVFSVGTSVHREPWSADIKWRYISGYPLTQDGSLHAPSAIVTNLRVQRQLGASSSVSVDLLNLFDRRYFDIAYGQDYRISPNSPANPNGTTVHPGEPRQLRVTVQLAF